MKQPLVLFTAALALVAPLSANASSTPFSDARSGALLFERWTGLGTQSSSESPSNSGTLAAGVLPNSMSAATLLKLDSGSTTRASRSLYSSPVGTGLSVPSGYDEFAEAMDILEGKITTARAQEMVSAGFALVNEGRLRIESTLASASELGEIVFQINITGYGPAAPQVVAGTHVSSFELTQMFVPVTLSINGLAPVAGNAVRVLYNDAYNSGQSHGNAEVEEIWAVHWDLSSFADPVERFEVAFANYPHSSIRGLQIEAYGPEAIPEPSTWALLAMGLGYLLWRVRPRLALAKGSTR